MTTSLYLFKLVEAPVRESCEGCVFEEAFERLKDELLHQGICTASQVMDCCPEEECFDPVTGEVLNKEYIIVLEDKLEVDDE